MGAYENPQVFAPDYRVIQPSFQQGFNTSYQVMQQRKAKKEAQKKKRDEAEAAFYTGTSLSPVLGLDKKWNNIIGDYYRQHLGGFEGYDDMTQVEKAELQANVAYMESGMKGLSETILKYQTGNYSSAIDPSILGLLDRIVYPKKDDSSGEWSYDIRLGEDGVEFFYTEDGEEHAIPITRMSTWGQLFEDPTKYVDNIRKNITDEIDSIKNSVRVGQYNAEGALEHLKSNDYYSNILDFDAKDIGTINYYSQYVNKGGDYHPTKEMMEKELDAIKKKGIKGIDDDDVITDEEVKAYHAHQDQEIMDHIDADILNQLTTHELDRRPQFKETLYNTQAEADAFIASEKVRLAKTNPGFTYTGSWIKVTDNFGNEKYQVKLQQFQKRIVNPPNVDTTGDGNPDTYMTRTELNEQIAAIEERNLRITKSGIRGEFEKKIHSIKTLVNDPNVSWESYNQLVKKHLLELIDPEESKELTEKEKEKRIKDLGRPLTPTEEYKTIVTLEDINEDNTKDDQDVHAYINNKYLGLGEKESILTDQLFKKYKFIQLFTRLKIPHVDPRTGKEVIISNVTPTTLENGDKVLRFDTYYNGKPFPVNIPLDEENLSAVVDDFMSTLSDDQTELTNKLNTMIANRRRQFGREDFYKYMTYTERIETLVDLEIKKFNNENIDEKLYTGLVGTFTEEDKKLVNELFEERKKKLKK